MNELFIEIIQDLKDRPYLIYIGIFLGLLYNYLDHVL